MVFSVKDVQIATEADLDALVRIQFAVLHKPAVDGDDTPKSRTTMAERHKEHMCANPGLVIAKVQRSDGKIVGFCMFYFTDQSAASEQKRVPSPLRLLTDDKAWARITVEAPWVDDQELRISVETQLRYIHQENQKHVAGRKCAYVRYMCVDPDFQRQGVGRALMSWACNRFDESKVDAYLEASLDGEKLYGNFGFKIIGHSEGEFVGGPYSHMWREVNGK